MTDYGERLKAEFEIVRPKYDEYTRSLSGLLARLLEDKGVDYSIIESRTKSIESFYSKVESPEKAQKYQSCHDLTDLSGVRIVCYLQQDVYRICRIIEDSLEVDSANSLIKDDILDPDQFGYLSLHLVSSYTDARLSLPEYTKYRGLRAEIQIRTLLQHTWAAIDWKLRYKNNIDTPKQLLRRLYRISALLEVADVEFSQLSQDIESLKRSYEEKIVGGDLKIDLNSESIDLFARHDKSVKDLTYVAEKSGYTIAPPHPKARNPYYALLATLSLAGVERIEELRSVLLKVVSSDGKLLKDVFNAWSTPGKPPRLVTDISALIRIATVLAVPRNTASAILKAQPFGPELQRSIHQVVG
jgi:putative GTP pyrophosphokinase